MAARSPAEQPAAEAAELAAPSAEGAKQAPARVSYADILRTFALLGWTAFGGPVASVGLFEKTCVEREGWLSTEAFAELFAVCQCLPGPSAIQMSFALGTVKKGICGGLISGALFQYPGALIMTGLGLTAHSWASTAVIQDRLWLAGLVGGLSATGVALAASAAVSLWGKSCAAADTKVLAGSCTVVLLYYCSALLGPQRDGRAWMWIFPAMIAAGGAFTFVRRGPLRPTAGGNAADATDADLDGIEHLGLGPLAGGALIAAVFLFFVICIVLITVLDFENNKYFFWFSAFWRTGTVLWGGGPVVLPLLAAELVSPGWVESSVFYAGLALAQAMPGPLFNFAAYLGAVVGYKYMGTIGEGLAAAAVSWLGLFGPGVLLLFGLLPFWGRFRKKSFYKRALPGLNAAAVGLLLASLVQMVAAIRGGGTKPQGPVPREASTCIGLVAFWAIHWLKLQNRVLTSLQAPMVVVAGGTAGIIAGVLNML